MHCQADHSISMQYTPYITTKVLGEKIIHMTYRKSTNCLFMDQELIPYCCSSCYSCVSCSSSSGAFEKGLKLYHFK